MTTLKDSPTVTFVTAIGNPLAYENFDLVLDRVKDQFTCMSNMKGNYQYIVVTNENEAINSLFTQFSSYNQNWELVKVNFDPPLDMTEQVASFGSESYNKFMKDKGSRLIIGLKKALENNSKFVFFIDCDDFLNNNIPVFLESCFADICFANQGYFIDTKSNCFKPTAGIFRYCGSTVCYDAEFIQKQFPQINEVSFTTTKNELFELFDQRDIALIFGDHMEWFYKFANEKGAKIQSFPFDASAWLVNTGANVSRASFGNKSWLNIGPRSLEHFGVNLNETNTLVQKNSITRLTDIFTIYIKKYIEMWVVNRSFKKKKIFFSLEDYMRSFRQKY